ncbi:hypothetical protein Aeqsu_0266 [Aequorivita sublithincola DSM 14238]|uniref:DUF4249 domain-containing protein n=1 Tax=Aequorivita sublithincola (strain DSM 14238 / LMG 21431 / ACAM 643 / 9-3) TaxID=746697 RepID=I3YS19_AEQSU|nr:DUF4249 domain-containing protein [Aequorivita sublithincola]AFL79787.1 hypothetical protein Aeqsu_0266 [Aequorivita sublithincola DSM 14238]
MKKLFLLVIFFGILTSCEDVIDVELNDAPPRLVIEANCNKTIESEQVQARVRLTTTKPFFGNENTIVDDAEVRIITEEGYIVNLEYFNDGTYTAPFPVESGKDYKLEVIYKDEIYTATEQLYTTSPLEFVEQRDDGGFTGEDIELKAFFTDPANETNFYFFEGLSQRGRVLDVSNDEFYNGNTIFGYYLVEDLASGDKVQFNLYGVNEAFYNFMFVLLQQTGGGGGPFETQPATVRGNIVNQTNPENYPLGYFRISEISTLNYTVE